MSQTQQGIEVRKPGGLSDTTWGKLQDVDPTTRAVAVALLEGRVEFEQDPAKLQAEIARRYLNAPTADAALEPSVVTHADTLIGVPLLIQDFRFNPSDMENSFGAYAMMDVVNQESGEILMVSCGSVNVCAQLVKLKLEDALPRSVKIARAERPTAQGYFPMWLTKP